MEASCVNVDDQQGSMVVVDVEKCDDEEDDGSFFCEASTSQAQRRDPIVEKVTYMPLSSLVNRNRQMRCQLCFHYGRPHEMQRLPLREEKYMPILRQACQDSAIICDIIERLKLRRGVRVCKTHFPKAQEDAVPDGFYADRVYPIRCKFCGAKQFPMQMRSIPTSAERREVFYDSNKASEGKKQEIESIFAARPRANLLVCAEHIPFPKDRPRSASTATDEAKKIITNQDGTVVKLRPKTACSEKKARRNMLYPPVQSTALCHWCGLTGSPKKMRKFPDYPEAVEQFFIYNNASAEKKQEILDKVKQRLRGVRMCYSHFPVEWARARGRYWYKLYFGTEEEKARARMSKERREERNSKVIYPNGDYGAYFNYCRDDTMTFRHEMLKNNEESRDYEGGSTSEDEEIDVEGLPPLHTLAGPPNLGIQGDAYDTVVGEMTSRNQAPPLSGGQLPRVVPSSATTSIPHPSPVYPPSYPGAPLRQNLEAAQALCSLGYGVQPSVPQTRPLPDLSTLLSTVASSPFGVTVQQEGAGRGAQQAGNWLPNRSGR